MNVSINFWTQTCFYISRKIRVGLQMQIEWCIQHECNILIKELTSLPFSHELHIYPALLLKVLSFIKKKLYLCEKSQHQPMILAFRRPALLALSLSCSISLFLSQYLSIHLSALAHFFRGRGRLPNSTARRLPYFHRTLNPFNADQQVFPRAEICKFIRWISSGCLLWISSGYLPDVFTKKAPKFGQLFPISRYTQIISAHTL